MKNNSEKITLSPWGKAKKVFSFYEQPFHPVNDPAIDLKEESTQMTLLYDTIGNISMVFGGNTDQPYQTLFYAIDLDKGQVVLSSK